MGISIYRNIIQTTDGDEISIAEFLENLRDGKWRKAVEPIRNEPDKRRRKKLKAGTLPYVTVSGTFDKRSEKGLKEHSSYICADMDEIKDLSETKGRLKNDPYTYALFTSVSCTGLACI